MRKKLNKKNVKNKPLLKKQINDLIDAWTQMNILAVTLKEMKKNPERFSKNIDLYSMAHYVYKKLDSIVTKLPD